MDSTSPQQPDMNERAQFMELVGLLSAGAGPEEMLSGLLPLLQHWSGCEAVGIRLRAGHDHPYVETEGFSEDFIRFEGTLKADTQESSLPDTNAKPDRQPLCESHFNSSYAVSPPVFTAHGSFWNNGVNIPADARGFTDLPTDAGRPVRCHSLALVPLRYRGETFGLLLFNGQRQDLFTPELISFLEKLADNVALALSRIQMEKIRQESEELYRAMFYANVAVKLLIEPATGAIVDANPAACDYYGYTHQEMLGLSIFDINDMPSDQVSQLMGLVQAAGCRHFLFKHRLASGDLRDVEVYSGPLQRQGRTLVFSIIHDVTDRVKAEEMRLRVEGMLQHDLKSPLSGMIGLSRLVEESISGGRAKEWAKALREGSEGMYQLVELNMDIFKMEQGIFTLVPKPCDLACKLRSLQCVMTPNLDRNEQELELLLGKTLLLQTAVLLFRGNPALLESMLSNLLHNALEASPKCGKITVTAQETPTALTVEIHNQGVVPEDVRSRFFQKYATSGKAYGTGLGTYSARLIARAHGGDITFTSSETDGTRVLVTLPRQPV